MPKITDVRMRRGTAAAWASINPVLGAGEPGLETDTGKLKFGNGTAAWNALPYGIPGGTGLQTTDQTGAWDTWRKALANMANETVRMLHIGDSITEGTGVGTRQQTWPYLVAKKIREAYPSIPGNAVTTSTGWSPVLQTSSTLPSTWTVAGTYDGTKLFGFRFTKGVALNPGATVTGTVVGTSIDIWYPKGTATGNFTVKVDGVQIGGTYGGTNAATVDGFVTRISLGTAGSHTVVITSTHATNQQYINGITVFNGNENSGVVSINAGFHGSNSANWYTAATNTNWLQNIPALDPHLVTIELGANDYSAALGYAGFKNNLRTLVENIRANCDIYPSIVFVAVHKRSENVIPAWGNYEFGLQQLAAELGCGFIDCRRVMADVGSAEAVAAGLYVDTVHPSAAGYALMADEIARVLLDPTTGVLMVPPNPAPVGHTHSVATTVDNGFMSAVDKAKLDTLSPLIHGTGDRAVIVPSLASHGSMLTDPTNRLAGADGSKFFTLFDARGKIASPLDNYYGYTSGHNSTQIWLVTGPTPAGPWTYRQAVRTLGTQTPLLNNNHLSSPDVVWWNNQVYLYYHGSKPAAGGVGQATALATSTDGVNFTEKPALALNCVYEEDRTRYYAVSTTYCRMVDAGGYLACVFQANTNLQNDQSANATPTSVGFATSRDGISWEISPVPLMQMTVGTSGPFGPGLAKIGGMWWLTAYVPADNKVNLYVSDRLEPGTFVKQAAWFGPPAGFDWVDSPIIKYLEGQWHLWYGATDSTYARYGETFHAVLNWSI